MDGKTYVVTNAHVVRGNTKVTFKTMSNQPLTTGPLEIAESADLVRADVSEAPDALDILKNIEDATKIGEAVVVMGNSEGEGVVRELEGRVVGIGPDRVEVDAPFVPGNSGSPILLKASGEVIGVATYLLIPRALQEQGKGDAGAAKAPLVTSLNEVRRFGFRLDVVDKWLAPEPDRLVREGLKLADIELATEVIMAAAQDVVLNPGARTSESYMPRARMQASPALSSLGVAINDFSSSYKNSATRLEKIAAANVLFQKLRDAAAADVKGFKPEHFSGCNGGFFRKNLDKRKRIYQQMEEIKAEFNLFVSRPVAAPVPAAAPAMPAPAPAAGDYTIIPGQGPFMLRSSKVNSGGNEAVVSEVVRFEIFATGRENYCWVVQLDGKVINRYKLTSGRLAVPTPRAGDYKVFVAKKSADGRTLTISSTVVTFTATGNPNSINIRSLY
ncbi:MAG: trypsin-like peptidase domain-containing protein [Verrucomicrobiaceae bacterium]|nr:trypsin-like peptidase domain-containing protein [Verrucomicrobiaceae bacterium]